MNKDKKSWVRTNRRNRSDVEDYASPVNIELDNHMTSVRDEGSVDTAINVAANFFSNRNLT